MNWDDAKKKLGVSDLDELGETSLSTRRAAAAYWAYNLLSNAFKGVESERSDPRLIAIQDQRATAIRDMLHATGIDLGESTHRDILAIFCTLMHQTCDGEGEIAEFTMTICEMALKAEPNAPAGKR